MSIFLSTSAIFWRSDFAAIYQDDRQQNKPNSKSVSYYNNRLTVLCSLSLDSCKIWAPKNGAGAQKNARIFKSNALTWLKLGVGLDHMYTKDWNFLDPSV